MFKVNFYNYPFKALTGGPLVLGKGYQRGPILVVNTASECGLTPQLGQLEELYQHFKDQGFEVLAFPSDRFGGQEPLEGEAIGASISTDTKFPQPFAS